MKVRVYSDNTLTTIIQVPTESCQSTQGGKCMAKTHTHTANYSDNIFSKFCISLTVWFWENTSCNSILLFIAIEHHLLALFLITCTCTRILKIWPRQGYLDFLTNNVTQSVPTSTLYINHYGFTNLSWFQLKSISPAQDNDSNVMMTICVNTCTLHKHMASSMPCHAMWVWLLVVSNESTFYGHTCTSQCSYMYM